MRSSHMGHAKSEEWEILKNLNIYNNEKTLVIAIVYFIDHDQRGL